MLPHVLLALHMAQEGDLQDPKRTIKTVFKWPTTVLSTAPAPPMMKNWLKIPRSVRRLHFSKEEYSRNIDQRS